MVLDLILNKTNFINEICGSCNSRRINRKSIIVIVKSFLPNIFLYFTSFSIVEATALYLCLHGNDSLPHLVIGDVGETLLVLEVLSVSGL